ncbi:hypothetical protein BS17DRAFT_84754 [Gyrodon lividus]|nr:hypothetical protein BS17DRAFT_84754 [Gyrodon lividus]
MTALSTTTKSSSSTRLAFASNGIPMLAHWRCSAFPRRSTGFLNKTCDRLVHNTPTSGVTSLEQYQGRDCFSISNHESWTDAGLVECKSDRSDTADRKFQERKRREGARKKVKEEEKKVVVLNKVECRWKVASLQQLQICQYRLHNGDGK